MIKLMKSKCDKLLKILFILLSVLFIVPSITYLIKNRTVMGFNIYYNFFINNGSNKMLSSIVYIIIFSCMMLVYILIIKRKHTFKNIKSLLIFVTIISGIFIIMLPWTSSDIFYYMGVGELDSVYHQNAYYITMAEYYDINSESINDEIFEQGANNGWANTTVVYGPIAQFIFSVCSKVSFKNINMCLLVFKLVNIIVHILNCYLIYKITKKIRFSIMYGLNPFIFLEFIGMVHNDIIIVFFTLLALYFILKKKNLIVSILFLALATGIKYYTILLLPIFVLYHFRSEKKVSKRLVKCIAYGLLFLIIVFLEYVIYLKDVNVFTAMMAQTTRYCKSVYSALVIISSIFSISITWVFILRYVILMFFSYIYISFCVKLLLNKKINFLENIRKYNLIFIVFLLALSNFQQWYMIGFFPTIMWQKQNTIKNIIGLMAISEIANSIYMFKVESWAFDYYFVGIIILLLIIWKLCTNKRMKNRKHNNIAKI